MELYSLQLPGIYEHQGVKVISAPRNFANSVILFIGKIIFSAKLCQDDVILTFGNKVYVSLRISALFCFFAIKIILLSLIFDV